MRLSTLVGYRGLSYRQLDHWARRGFLGPALARGPGSGTERNLSAADVERIKTIADLLDAGFRLPAAARLANTIVAGGLAGDQVRLNDCYVLRRADRPDVTPYIAGAPDGAGVTSGP